LNNDGKFESNEPSMVTGSGGAYSFTGLGPAVVNGVPDPTGGIFHVREIQQPGYVQTQPAAGSYTVTLTSGATVSGDNFGNRHPTSGGTNPVPILVAGEDAGGLPLVTVRDLTTGSVSTFDGYNPGFRGGVRVATGNFTGGA